MAEINPPDHLKRVAVVGSSCAGKSTFSNKLSEILGIRHVMIDELAWMPGWKKRSVDEMRELLREECAGERWIVDGNYASIRDVIWLRATAVIWLDLSFPVVMFRAIKRSLKRVYTGEEIYSGNRETFRLAFMSRDSVIYWAAMNYRRRNNDYARLMADTPYAGLRFIRLKGQKGADEFLNDLKTDL